MWVFFMPRVSEALFKDGPFSSKRQTDHGSVTNVITAQTAANSRCIYCTSEDEDDDDDGEDA